MVSDSAKTTESFSKVILITGASKGIGEGCARVFCRTGAKVVICARGKEAGQSLATELTAKGPGECHFERCDVSRPEEIKELVDKVVKRFNRLDCLINNAGYHPPQKPIDDFSLKELMDVLQINLISYFVACKHALPHLRKVQGNIINISSLVGKMGQEGATTYCATKGGITAFSKALAIEEMRYGVRVNIVLPGNIITDSRIQMVARSQNPEAMNQMADALQWCNRSGTIEEVGEVCLFLASDAASYVTGIEFIISGGAELGYGKKYPYKFLK